MAWSVDRDNEYAVDGLFFSEYQRDCDDKGGRVGKKDEDGRTRIIIARTEYGQMVDFLRANPYVTREEYMWELTVPQAMLARYDYTHIEYLSEEEAKAVKNASKVKSYDNPKDLVNDLGIPIF